MAETVKSSPEYAMLPAGTVVMWGKSGESQADFQPLINCKALGATGATGSFVDCTTLIDKQKQFLSDLPEGPEKTLGFIDDPNNESFTDFLNAAENRETIQFYMELPNGRTATMVMALSGWQINEITAPASEVIQITVNGKQNNIVWGTKGNSTGTLESVVIDEESPLDLTITEGEGRTFKAVVKPEGAKVTLSWASSNEKTAQIESETGKFHPNAFGTTEIKVTATPASGTPITSKAIIVNVKPDPVKITISGEQEVTVSEDETYAYTAKLDPADDSTAVSWSTSDSDIATINSKGELTAKAPGKVDVIVTAKPASDEFGAENTAKYSVTVKVAPSVTFAASATAITADAPVKFTATPVPADAEYVYTWVSSNTAVGTFPADQHGKEITLTLPGTAPAATASTDVTLTVKDADGNDVPVKTGKVTVTFTVATGGKK